MIPVQDSLLRILDKIIQREITSYQHQWHYTKELKLIHRARSFGDAVCLQYLSRLAALLQTFRGIVSSSIVTMLRASIRWRQILRPVPPYAHPVHPHLTFPHARKIQRNGAAAFWCKEHSLISHAKICQIEQVIFFFFFVWLSQFWVCYEIWVAVYILPCTISSCGWLVNRLRLSISSCSRERDSAVRDIHLQVLSDMSILQRKDWLVNPSIQPESQIVFLPLGYRTMVRNSEEITNSKHLRIV